MGTANRLLLVDSEPAGRAALRAHLSPLGYQVFEAASGADALALFDAQPVDLILLDLMMPDLDGIHVLDHVRAHGARGQTPVILLTEHSVREQRLRGLEAGADEFLEKPFDAAVLLARVKTLLRLKEFHDGLLASRDELARQNVELASAHKLQRELTDFIVHDLKGPLTAVTANAEWVYEQLAGQPTSLLQAVEDVLLGATRLRSLISDLLLVSQLEHGTFPLSRAPVDVGELVRCSVNQVRREAEQKRVTVSQSTELGTVANADPTLIHRVLSNLLDNSLRFTPSGGRIAVSARVDRGLDLRVANSGPAIPAADRARIFEKFARGAGGERQMNAGLGLYFCRRAVEAHGGRIVVEDFEDFPTCFRVQVPAA